MAKLVDKPKMNLSELSYVPEVAKGVAPHSSSASRTRMAFFRKRPMVKATPCFQVASK